MKEIERLAQEYGSKEITCEVYDKSEHAKSFMSIEVIRSAVK